MFQSVNLGVVNVSVPLLEGIELAGKHGFHGIAMHPDQILEAGKDKVEELLKKYDMRYSGFNLPQEYKSPDESEFWKGAEILKRNAALAGSMGCIQNTMWIIPSHPTLSYREHFEFLADRLSVYASILKENGISLALEFVGPEKAWNRPNSFAHNIPQMLELCGAVGRNCGLLLDSHHAYATGHDMREIYHLQKDQIKLVHVNDSMPGVPRAEASDNPRALPGETGVIDIAVFMDALKTIGYEGPVEAEPFSPKLAEMGDPDRILAAVKASMDKIWPAE